MSLKDYIIVGQGIAGSVLAYELLNREKDIIIFDNDEYNATKVASGIINPITGRNYVKTWMADEIIPNAVSFYQNVEKEFNSKFFRSIPVYKLFYSKGNINDWSLRAGNPEYSSFLKSERIIELDKNKAKNDFGAFEISNTYSLDTSEFLKTLKNYFKEKEIRVNEKFDFSNLVIKENILQYKEIEAKKIIFCEGYSGKFNPYFDFLPFNPSKGECLHVKINNFYDDRIISGNYFTMPLENDKYYVGSTNHWDFTDNLPTDEGKKELSDGLTSLTSLPFSIIDHKAAIRPTVKDRKPLLGLHPVHSQFGIFNGLGTKGISLAPYFAKHFCDFLTGNARLSKDADTKRFLK